MAMEHGTHTRTRARPYADRPLAIASADSSLALARSVRPTRFNAIGDDIGEILGGHLGITLGIALGDAFGDAFGDSSSPKLEAA